jgi:membrane protein
MNEKATTVASRLNRELGRLRLTPRSRGRKVDHATGFEPLDSSSWADIGLCVLRSILENRLLATAGGVAFFALMAIFPALATIVSLYGLFADPHAIPERLAILAGVVPASAIDLLKQQVLSLAENQISTLSIAFLIGFLVSMWSANSGVSALFDALNVVHGARKQRVAAVLHKNTGDHLARSSTASSC